MSTLLIAAPVAPMFAAPDAASEQVSQALLGMAVRVVEERGEWSRLRTPDGYEGWAASSGLTAAPEGWTAPFREVDDLWANLRAASDSRQAAVLHAPIGTQLPQCGEAAGWVQLLLPDGRRLWTEAHRARPKGVGPCRSRSRSAMIRTARRFLGVPYLWGGNSPWGLDCSGFVQLVYRLHGYSLRRDAHMQFADGTPAGAPIGGDLVFFGPEGQPECITHVGMMLDDRRYIHAKGSACVRIDVLDPASPTFRGGRRFF